MKKILLHILTGLLIGTYGFAQTPQPAQPQNEAILLKGGTAHIGNGEVIENALIGFDNGRLTLVVDARRVRIDVAGYKVIDVSGQHIYPGFVLPDSQIGLREVTAIDAMDDQNEVGELKPNVRSLIAFNTDSKISPTLRYNGVLIVESTPVGGRISGTSSVMNLEGWNWEDAALKADIGIHMNWPHRISRQFDFETFTYNREPNKEYGSQVQELDAFFQDARSYSRLVDKERNLKLEAMGGLFTGDKILFIHAGGAKEIVESVRFAEDHEVEKIVILAGDVALDAASFLAEHKISVILPPTHQLPDNADIDVYLPFKMPYLLTKAGVTVALSHDGMLANARNLPFYAGSAAAYGLSKEEALQLITLNAAKALGIDGEAGSIEEGKRATLFVSKGDALDMMSNNLSYAFIDGKQIVLDNEQQALYKRYTEKYQSEK